MSQKGQTEADLKAEIESLNKQIKVLLAQEIKLNDMKGEVDQRFNLYKNLYTFGQNVNKCKTVAEILELTVEFIVLDLNLEKAVILKRDVVADNEISSSYRCVSSYGYYEEEQEESVNKWHCAGDDKLSIEKLFLEKKFIHEETDSEELAHIIKRALFVDEFYMVGFNEELSNCEYILVTGNSSDQAPFQARVTKESYVFIGLGNLIALSDSNIRNLNAFNKLEDMVEERTRDIRSILANIQLGIFAVTPDLKVHGDYSKYLESIYDTSEIEGVDVIEQISRNSNLSTDQTSMLGSALMSALGELDIAFTANESNLVKSLVLHPEEEKEKHLEYDWSPVVNSDDVTEKILVAVRDVTKIKQLEQQSKQKDQELVYISEIVAVPEEQFHRFILLSRDFLEQNTAIVNVSEELVEDTLKIMFINMHTLKGISRSLGFTQLTTLMHDCEQSYAALLNDRSFWDKEKLLKDLEDIKTLLHHYDRVSREKLGRSQSDTTKISVSREKLETIFFHFAQLQRDIGNQANDDIDLCLDEIKGIISIDASDFFKDVLAQTEALAKDLNKDKPIIQINSSSVRLTNSSQELPRNVFIHIVRNSMDHGIEEPEERIKKDKDAAGLIKVDVKAKNGGLFVSYCDDGRGLNAEKIRVSALEKGIIDEGVRDWESICQLIFHSGFSTRTSVSDISGRGVGMDAIKQYIQNEGGSLNLVLGESHNAEAIPFRLEIELPEKFLLAS
ncbi:MAG: Hpt domain-containing protein [Pseudobacteriovorax sp.]|nr:Hpt domain-containing protein [Pseudobacteriovorax sp.]